MALIDFHCHLDLYPEPKKVAQEAARLGVYVLSVTTTPSAFLGTKALAPEGSRIRTALGLHPEIAVARERELPLFEKLLPQTDYVGEIGLDGSRPHKDSLDRQGAILTEILTLCARAGGKVLSLHSRGATRLILDVLEHEPLAGTSVLHWFTGSERETVRAAEMGCWFSVGFPMLQSEAGRKRVKQMPIDRILPETDGPFGTKDDQPLFPWEGREVITSLAETLNVSASEIEAQLDANFKRFTAANSDRRRNRVHPKS
jgi:TatD DNase family protein